ncbi:cuticle protein 18.6-like [Malaya genurostris]|uniref:cuticle protein 18.6-like n=1 Tax=Malaya genurostris TaxID=325434 RepID=UPI0026F390E0|nr:cuticle protein 18.6-like [Malaya genurostris]
MFAKIIFLCVVAFACVSAKPQFPLAYSAPLVASPSVSFSSPYAAAYTAPVAAAYTAASAPLTAAYTSYPYPYAAYNSVFL